MKVFEDKKKSLKIVENTRLKIISSPDYNLIFRKDNGFTARWGRTQDDDPYMCPIGCEIIDIEVSTSIPDNENPPNVIITEGNPCKKKSCSAHCYKRNSDGNRSAHMSLDTVKKIIQRLPKSVTQTALGILSVYSHPQLWDILIEFRNSNIIPNLTLSDENITDEAAQKLSELCGACACSVNRYNKDGMYNTIEKLSQKYKMEQVNIHFVVSQQSIDSAFEIVDDIKNDKRLSKLNALVLLHLKKKGSALDKFEYPSFERYRELVEYCEKNGVRHGFDSCSCGKYLKIIKDRPNYKQISELCEPCESGLFSQYLNCFGVLYPCSFAEGIEEGINILDYENFQEIWHSKTMSMWRKKLLAKNRSCPIYEI